jgi:hypothetical protein
MGGNVWSGHRILEGEDDAAWPVDTAAQEVLRRLIKLHTMAASVT